MKIIENMRCQCVACNGSADKMILVAVPFSGAVFLCLSCAQEAGRLAELEHARESES